jgi:hypothetical protein
MSAMIPVWKGRISYHLFWKQSPCFIYAICIYLRILVSNMISISDDGRVSSNSNTTSFSVSSSSNTTSFSVSSSSNATSFSGEL